MLLIFTALPLAAAGCEHKAEPPATTSADWQDFKGSWNAAGTRRTIPLGNDRKGAIIDTLFRIRWACARQHRRQLITTEITKET